MIYCQVERDPVTVINGMRFDLPKQSYFLLLASGSGVRPTTVDYHDIVRLASAQSLRLSEVSSVAGRSKLLLRLHGAFMIVAWIGTASIGILLARYFKQTWVGSSACGKDIWFAVSSFGNRFAKQETSFACFPVAQNLYGHYMGINDGCFCYHFRRNQRMVDGEFEVRVKATKARL